MVRDCLGGVEVEFRKRDDGGSLAIIDRDDGVRLRLRSYDRTGRVPHDAVHLVGERALGVHGGLWGSIAEGALFDSLEVIDGRQPHDRVRRSDDVRRRNARELRLAERLVGALAEVIDLDARGAKRGLDRAWGVTEVGTAPFSPEQAAAAVEEVRALRVRWERLAPGEPGLPYTWPAARRRRSGPTRAAAPASGRSRRSGGAPRGHP
jgi:hypothetical protein